MRYATWVLATGVMASLVLGSGRAQAQEEGQNRRVPTIAVTGNSEVRIAPDEATVRLGVTGQAPTARAAQDKVNTTAQRILAAIEKLGIKREAIQTSQLSLFPVYSQQKPGEEEAPRVVAYNASNTVSVRLTDLKLVGPVVDAGLEAGANQVEGVSFGLRNDLEARLQALKQASQEARRKADALAEALGVQIAGVQEVTEGGNVVQPMFDRAMFARAGGEAATPVAPGEVTVSASVTVRYRINGR